MVGANDAIIAEESSLSVSGIVGLVVAYRPIRVQIERLVRILAQECMLVYVMDNGGAREALAEILNSCATVRILDMDGNRGLGEALNRGVRLAQKSGASYVATFDQDSEPAIGMAAALIKAYEELTADGARVAAVGPRIVDARVGNSPEYPFMRTRRGWPRTVRCTSGSRYVEADYLITSGCLIPVGAFEIVGLFDEALFVDCTDMEWCFRAGWIGLRLYGICGVSMDHELGTGGSAKVLGLSILGHSPLRRYYYARNTVRLMKLRYVPLGWKIRMLIGVCGRLLLFPVAVRFAHGWTRDWLMLVRGACDGFLGMGGVCRYDRERSI